MTKNITPHDEHLLLCIFLNDLEGAEEAALDACLDGSDEDCTDALDAMHEAGDVLLDVAGMYGPEVTAATEEVKTALTPGGDRIGEKYYEALDAAFEGFAGVVHERVVAV